MGCGASKADEDLKRVTFSGQECHSKGTGRIANGVSRDRLEAVAKSASTYSKKVGVVMNSQPTKLVVREESAEKARTSEEGEFDLPEGEFMDGMLGLTINDEKIQQIVDGMEEGDLFEDFEFPTETALFYSDRSMDNVVWLRPKDLTPSPVLFLNGISRHDIAQGILGDCWFLSSCAAVARMTELMQRLIPPNQPLYGDEYKGIVQFCFWRFGHWVKVYIDDQLPTVDGQLIYARCSDPSEFWVALMEKAYAKLHGSYEAIEGGQTMDALVDLTSGLAERYELTDAEESLYKHLLCASKWGAFITCSRKGDWRKSHQADTRGLVAGHAYTITDVKGITTNSSDVTNLLRIRNPWGNEAEWNGLWSDASQMWGTVDEADKLNMDYKSENDGEFWMNFTDFCTEFEEVSICTLGPDFNKDGLVDKSGQVKAIKGAWEPNKSCGGSRNDFIKFATNPQYLLTITTPDENANDEEGKCHVVVSLMQEHRLSERYKGIHMHQIGFVIYKTDDDEHRLPAEHFMYNYSSGSTGTFINYREVFGRFELDPGYYVIIPATFEPECPSNFMIRVYAAHSFSIRELHDSL